jgi:hypothetical protein
MDPVAEPAGFIVFVYDFFDEVDRVRHGCPLKQERLPFF